MRLLLIDTSTIETCTLFNSFNPKLVIDQTEHKERLSGMMSLIDNSIITVRKIVSDLRPPVLNDPGLIDAIKWQVNEFIKQNEIEVNFTTNINDIKFSSEITTTVFRIFQEALTNIARHAQASIVNCNFQKTDGHHFINIEDNGVGMILHNKEKTSTLGLLGMKERVHMVDGHLQIISEPDKGAAILITIPLSHENINS